MFMNSMERPKADVRDVSVTSAGFSSIQGQLDIDITNPNSFGVPISRIDWELSIAGAPAVTGRVDLHQTIPAKGVAPITTSLTINPRDAIAVAENLGRGARDYSLSAHLHFAAGFGDLEVDVKHDGTLGGASSAISRVGSLLR